MFHLTKKEKYTHFLGASRMIFKGERKKKSWSWIDQTTGAVPLFLYMTVLLGNYYTIYGSISVCKLIPLDTEQVKKKKTTKKQPKMPHRQKQRKVLITISW